MDTREPENEGCLVKVIRTFVPAVYRAVGAEVMTTLTSNKKISEADQERYSRILAGAKTLGESVNMGVLDGTEANLAGYLQTPQLEAGTHAQSQIPERRLDSPPSGEIVSLGHLADHYKLSRYEKMVAVKEAVKKIKDRTSELAKYAHASGGERTRYRVDDVPGAYEAFKKLVDERAAGKSARVKRETAPKDDKDYCSMASVLEQAGYSFSQRKEIMPKLNEEIRQGKSQLEAYTRKWSRGYQVSDTREAARHVLERVEALGFKKKQ